MLIWGSMRSYFIICKTILNVSKRTQLISISQMQGWRCLDEDIEMFFYLCSKWVKTLGKNILAYDHIYDVKRYIIDEIKAW